MITQLFRPISMCYRYVRAIKERYGPLAWLRRQVIAPYRQEMAAYQILGNPVVMFYVIGEEIPDE